MVESTYHPELFNPEHFRRDLAIVRKAVENLENLASKALRDEFAMAALCADSVGDCAHPETLAQRAYRVADAMLQERAKCE